MVTPNTTWCLQCLQWRIGAWCRMIPWMDGDTRQIAPFFAWNHVENLKINYPEGLTINGRLKKTNIPNWVYDIVHSSIIWCAVWTCVIGAMIWTFSSLFVCQARHAIRTRPHALWRSWKAWQRKDSVMFSSWQMTWVKHNDLTVLPHWSSLDIHG